MRIDEVMRGLPDIASLNKEALEKDAKESKAALQENEKRLSNILAGGKMAQLGTLDLMKKGLRLC